MLWIGGGQGAGKTTLSWRLARVNDLPLHPVDLWASASPDEYAARTAAERQLITRDVTR